MSFRIVQFPLLCLPLIASMVGRAEAGESPPPGYAYSYDFFNLTAFNVIQNTPEGSAFVYTDPTRNSKLSLQYIDPPTGMLISGVWQSLGSGFSDPSAPVGFDIFTSESNGVGNEFAGYSQLYSVPLSHGHKLTHWEQEVNGEFHQLNAETDRDGNVVSSTLVTDKRQRTSDRCKLVSDYGETYCPSYDGPMPIPTSVQQLIQSVGFFSSVFHFVASTAKKVADAASDAVTDPEVQKVLIGVGTALGIATCIVTTEGTGTALCVASFATLEAAALGAINGSSDYVTKDQRGQLTSSEGYISCESPNCQYQTQRCDVIDLGCPF